MDILERILQKIEELHQKFGTDSVCKNSVFELCKEVVKKEIDKIK